MKLSIILDGRRLAVRLPHEGALVAEVDAPCPNCSAPLRVQGAGKRIKSHDTYEAPAICIACSAWVGQLEAKVNTLFGLEEDERISRMGIHIY